MATLVWFRNDLRVADNPAFARAARDGKIIPVFIFDSGLEGASEAREIGAASRWWLDQSLRALREKIGSLIVLHGDPRVLLLDLADKMNASAVVWNRRYDPYAIKRDKHIKAHLRDRGLKVQSFNASLLAEPWELATKSGTPFKVFTPFFRALRNRSWAAPEDAPCHSTASLKTLSTLAKESYLSPQSPNWAAGWEKIWRPGEDGARAQLDSFIHEGLCGYAKLRDRPDLPNVSRLSPHLRFGEISPRQIFAQAEIAVQRDPSLEMDAEKFLSELAWREFSYHLLFHFPDIQRNNWRSQFDRFPWRHCGQEFVAWTRGMTGYPLVDAGMRELWQTGYMHNRVRMVAASFLVKHLLIDWREGEKWFWDTLVDADPASNSASWQWVAGSGADAAPFFRIFNPVTQGQKFDPDGTYVRKWCPELSKLSDRQIHAPFDATPEELSRAEISLGETYPTPIVDHREARARALGAFETLK